MGCGASKSPVPEEKKEDVTPEAKTFLADYGDSNKSSGEAYKAEEDTAYENNDGEAYKKEDDAAYEKKDGDAYEAPKQPDVGYENKDDAGYEKKDDEAAKDAQECPDAAPEPANFTEAAKEVGKEAVELKAAVDVAVTEITEAVASVGDAHKRWAYLLNLPQNVFKNKF